MLRNRTGLLLAVAVAGVALALLQSWYADRGLPHFDGRSAREWFLRAHREHALELKGRPNPPAALTCRTAFIEMGSNVVPFLVREALAPRHDDAFRTNLHQFFSELPEWAGRGSFPPQRMATETAVSLIRALKPAASQLLPLLEPVLDGTNVATRRVAIILLGWCGADAGAAAEALFRMERTSRDPGELALIEQHLWQLADHSPAARTRILALDDSTLGHTGVLRRLGGLLGHEDTDWIPKLEPLLHHTNLTLRLTSALALLKVTPEHQGALKALITLPSSPPDQKAATDPYHSWELLTELGQGLQFMRFTNHSALGLIVEPLFRKEIAQWSRSSAQYRFAYAMERVAPDRTRQLLRDAVRDSGNPHAAGCLLRLDRTNEAAAQALVQCLESDYATSLPAMHLLGQASSSNETAMAFLERCASDSGMTGLPGQGRIATQTILRFVAQQALAEIRYREARVRHGLPESEW